MGNSSVTHPPQQKAPKRSLGLLRGLVTLIVRLAVLGISGSLAWFFGVAIAQFYPAEVSEAPFTESVFRGVGTLRQTIDSLQRQPTPTATNPTPAAVPPSTPVPTALPPLTEAQRQQIQAELAQIETQLSGQGDRLTQLETQLGLSPSSGSLEARIQQIQQRLDPTIGDGQTAPSAPVAVTNVATGRALLVTLPSDALFQPEGQGLTPSADPILASIANDLRAYPGAAIQVSAHTDGQQEAPRDRALTFEQAKAVQRVLERELGDDYTWVVIGYGATRPLVENTTSINRQRNRRVEIAINP